MNGDGDWFDLWDDGWFEQSAEREKNGGVDEEGEGEGDESVWVGKTYIGF